MPVFCLATHFLHFFIHLTHSYIHSVPSMTLQSGSKVYKINTGKEMVDNYLNYGGSKVPAKTKRRHSPQDSSPILNTKIYGYFRVTRMYLPLLHTNSLQNLHKILPELRQSRSFLFACACALIRAGTHYPHVT
jgi:hypothetical protein